MNIFKLMLLFFLRLAHVSAHGVQVAHCETASGKLRVFVEHWHGAAQIASASDTITIQVTAGDDTTVEAVPATGTIANIAIASLPGCATLAHSVRMWDVLVQPILITIGRTGISRLILAAKPRP
jgi:hypothetical protein